MVVNFAIKNGDDCSIFVENWLMACFRRDYGKAAMAERDILVNEKSVIIRAAMGLRIRHFPQQSFDARK